MEVLWSYGPLYQGTLLYQGAPPPLYPPCPYEPLVVRGNENLFFLVDSLVLKEECSVYSLCVNSLQLVA